MAETQGLLHENVNKEKKQKLDPILVQSITLNEDFYALTWNACRKEAWENKEIAKVPISPTGFDNFQLFSGFFLFITVVCLTVGILLYESFASDAYKEASWPIVILRITLVNFAQQKLKPEIFQGISILRYAFQHPNEFIHPKFAVFVGLSQTCIAMITFSSIFLFCCMADEALELIMNFAGLAVISELDNWVGEKIMSEKLYLDYEADQFKNITLDTKDLNEEMGLYSKMCLIGEEMEIIDNQNNILNNSKIYAFFTGLNKWIPYSLIPLCTIPFQIVLIYIHNYEKVKHEEVKVTHH